MNHLTPAEAFRQRISRLSRPQLEEALLVLRKHDEAAVDRALAFAATPFTALRWCTSRRNLGGDRTAVCEMLDGHAGKHASPGWTEDDPDIRWTDEPHVHAEGFGPALDGTDCGCGLGAARCRELEDGGAS